MILGRNAAARELGISGQALGKAFRDGRVKQTSDGDYDVEQCRIDLEQNSNPGKQASARAQQRNKPNSATFSSPLAAKSAPGAEDEDEDAIIGGEVPDSGLTRLSTSDLCKQELIEKILDRRMDRREREGQLLQRDDVKQAWCEGNTALRSQLLLLSSRLSPYVDPARVREGSAAIDAESRKLLGILSGVRVWE